MYNNVAAGFSLRQSPQYNVAAGFSLRQPNPTIIFYDAP